MWTGTCTRNSGTQIAEFTGCEVILGCADYREYQMSQGNSTRANEGKPCDILMKIQSTPTTPTSPSSKTKETYKCPILWAVPIEATVVEVAAAERGLER